VYPNTPPNILLNLILPLTLESRFRYMSDNSESLDDSIESCKLMD